MPTLPRSGESTPPLDEKSKSGPTTLISINSVAGESEAHLIKQFSFFSSIGMAFVILNSWIIATMTLNVGMAQGGPVVVLWGELIAGVGQVCIALCLSELCSIWPSQSAQYGWTYLVSHANRTLTTTATPTRWGTILSYYDGWLTWAGWCIMFSGAASVTTNMTYYLVCLWNPDFVLEPWHFFLLYVLCLTISLVINTFASRHLHMFDFIGIFWLAGGAIILIIATLACAGTKSTEPKFQSASFVFTTFINNSDWSNFVLFMTGMVQPTFTITCFDAVAHVIDEMPNPRRDAPRCITATVVFGCVSTFVVVLCLLFAITDIDAVVTSTAGPLVTILYQATGSRVGATCLTLIPYIGTLIGSQATLTTASRITLNLAEDEAVICSAFFRRVNKRFNAPIPALVVPWCVSVVIGLLYLGSSAMFSSILSTTLVALGISYLIPIIVVAIMGRSMILELEPQFSLGKVFGGICYAIAISWGLFTAVMFCFPATSTVNGSTMNYTAPVIGVAMLLATINWFVYSRKHFNGPQVVDQATEPEYKV
ncbi:hypothetical protein Q8F55_001604 [Vanrija albida]|uniref:Amino acid permease/ SLC12A domain-containing protein n=1 Tax=Vanrija albida TaxID=181172 RepID=A0ABR3QGJ0_9TREE